jgi:tetratricopeptide (TPR) repeat protein
LFRYIFISLLFLIFQSKINAQSWISKVWHNSVSHYNYYYNANVIVTDAREEALLGYKDDFKDVLSLYPFPDESILKGNASKMDEAIKKCSHIIDKHKYSKWVDDSYLLMGDARFFKGDFYSAIEVYEYVAANFKESIAAYQAEINLVTTYIKQGKKEDAEALYSKLKSKKSFPKKLQTQLDIAGASVNITQEKYLVAIKLLEEAIPHLKSKSQKVRTNFVLAQLYVLTNNNQKGIERYRKVIKLNPAYEFAFNAKLNIAKAINIKNRGEVRVAKNLLRDMLRDEKNVDYFDQIYFEIGNLELADKNETDAIQAYEKSLRSKESVLSIKSRVYLTLADLYFKRQDYVNAQVYYDSAARTVSPDFPNYKFIQDKNLVLNELIKHLVNIKEKDSLLKLSDNEKLREKTIDKLIKQEKDREEEAKRVEEVQKTQQNIQIQNNNVVTTTNFPFYNQAAKTKGLQDFQRIWGNRKLMDFWGISSNKTAIWKEVNEAQANNDYGGDEKNELIKGASDERKKYYEAIPFTKAEKEKMKQEIAESYFLGANVYYQNLKEFDKAKKMLEDLNRLYPKSSYEINSWYLLAKINKEQGDMSKYDYYVELIKNADSNSNFLNVLMRSDKKDSISESGIKPSDEVDNQFKEVYSLYKDKKFPEAIKLKQETDMKFPGNPLQENFDYLEALCVGELGDLKEFQNKLSAIVSNYPETPIAKQCEEIIIKIKIKNGEIVEDKSSITKYIFNDSVDHFYAMLIPKSVDFTKVKIAFLNRNKNLYPSAQLRVTNSLIGDKYQVLVVNNFKTLKLLLDYLKEIDKDGKFIEELKLSEKPQHFAISKENFSILLTDKIIEDYLEFYKKNYSKF